MGPWPYVGRLGEQSTVFEGLRKGQDEEGRIRDTMNEGMKSKLGKEVLLLCVVRSI